MPDRREVWFLSVVTALLTFAGAWFVWEHGSRLPVMDEWDLLSDWLVTPSTAEWLIAHHNEHRYPLTKLVWLGTLRATGYNSKPLLFIPFGLIAVSAVLLLRAVRAVRGRHYPIDVLVPVLLLHWGHGFNWLMAYQVGFALVAFGAAGWVWCAARWTAGGSRTWAWRSLAFAGLLVPCGGFGVAFTGPVVLWCAWVAWRERGKLALVAVVLGLAAAGYTAWVVKTMPEKRIATTGVNPTEAPVEFTAAVVGELSVAVGAWPARESVAARVAIALVVTGVYVWAVVRAVRTRTPFAVAALCVILGTLLTAAAMALARGVGFTERMADASAAGLATAWVLAVPSRRMFSLLAVAASVVIFWANISESRGYAMALHQSAYRVNRDIRAGELPLVIVGRHGHSHSVLVGDRLGSAMRRLKARGVRPFDALPDDPPFDVVPLLPAESPRGVSGTGELRLPDAPERAFALRVQAVSERVTDRDRVLLRWTDADTGAEHEDEAWVPPFVSLLDLAYRLRGRPVNIRLVPGPKVLDLRLDQVAYLLTPK